VSVARVRLPTDWCLPLSRRRRACSFSTWFADKPFAFEDITRHVTLLFGDTNDVIHTFAGEPGNDGVRTLCSLYA